MKKLLVVMLFLSFCSTVFGSSETFIASGNEKRRVIDQKNNKIRSEMTLSIEQRGDFYEYIEETRGAYDQFENIVKSVRTIMRENNGLIETVESTITVKDEQGHILAKYTKDFDYKGGKVIYRKYDNAGELEKEKKFKIKGPICDDTSLVYFAKIFAANHGDKKYKRYYLLSNEPKLYDIRVKDLGIVDFKLPSGKVVKAIKIQTIPSFGPLTGILAKLVPPTYLWYEAQPPHNFLQYEGLEVGLGGAVITSTVMQ